MVKTIEHFQTVNNWEQTKVIVVDKDLNEVQVLKRMFPDSRVLLCHFHVIKWLAKAVRDDKKYGTYPSEVLKQLDHCVSNMVYAKVEEDLQDYADEFKTLACRGDREALWSYFQDNWMDCKEMWVTAFRMHLPHFRNNTNNRLESFFGKLKADIDSSYSMKDCLKAILKFQRRKEDEYKTKTLMPGSVRNNNYGEERNQVLGMTTEWVAGIFYEEYQFATDPDSVEGYTYHETDNIVTARRDDRVHQVDKTTWMCDCEFSVTMKLPCRHVLLYRKHTGGYLTVPYSSIPPRWYRMAALDEVLPDITVPIRVISTSDEAKRKKQMTEKDKYKQAQNVFARITTELTDLTKDKFLAAIDNLEGWWSNLREGDLTVPSSTADDQQGEESRCHVPPAQIAVDAEADPDLDEKDEQIHDSGVAGSAIPAARAVKPFNSRAPKTGRPRKKRAQADPKRHAEKRTYNNGSKLRKELRDKDVLDVVQFVQVSKPGLNEIASFLDTFEIRYHGYEKKELTVKTFAPPAQVMHFRLPEIVVKAALTELRNLHRNQVVDLSIPDDGKHIWRVVCIEGAGPFSEQKLLAMEYLWNLAKTCKNGKRCFSWLMSDVDYQYEGEGAAEVANEMLGSWPHDKLVGFGFDVEWEHLYCARTEAWYNDVFINAFLTTLAVEFRNNTTLFLPPLTVPAPHKGRRVPVTTLSLLSDSDDDYVFMPINLNHSHWACLLIDRTRNNVVCYDSVDKRSHHILLMELAREIVSKCLSDFNHPYAVHSPIQKDSDSCGLFVCLFFWKRLHKAAGNDYTQEGILRRRWDILRAIVTLNTESKNSSAIDLQ
ncbi:hypothetical protein BBJ28_00021182 [Nothophytophthora sp. Chile5]|nr:hypothetical protein BBJ28_00021182 [Nothophytophthora sp. Chile5]